MATKIQVLRWKRRLSIREAAEQSGVSTMSICGAETGVKNVSDKTKYFMSEFYGVPENELFSGNRAIEA